MSHQKNANEADDPFFYIDREGEDITFYVPNYRSETSNEYRKLERQSAVSGVEGETKKGFSLPRKVRVKTLVLSKHSLKSKTFLAARHIKKDPNYSDLLKKTKLEQLGPETNDAQLLVKAFNDVIENDDLNSHAWLADQLTAADKEFLEKLSDPQTKQKWRNRLLLDKAFPDLLKESHRGRGLICLSYAGEYISVTVRRIRDEAGYEAGKYSPSEASERKKRLFSISEYCEAIYREVIVNTNSESSARGLLVVTGSTKSAKSEIARGLIFEYLKKLRESDRKPHLVTFEDPIERNFFNPDHAASYPTRLALKMPSGPIAIDYTPREKGKDAGYLREALEDALRQTPAVFFVGETRKKREWELLLDFASTGHLIVTTAHAGSLVEAMHKIFEARGVKTASDRSEIANKLLAVVHLGNTKIEHPVPVAPRIGGTPQTDVLFPALWRRSPRGLAALTSDGLSSLLPYRPDDSSIQDAPSCVGRRWFMDQLMKAKRNPEFPPELEGIESHAFRKATEWDLMGV